MSRDGLKVLGIGDRPEREWRKLGIWEEQPDYKLGTYNTQLIQIRDSEKDLFKLRQERDIKTVRDQAVTLLNEDGIEDDITDAVIIAYI